MQLGIVGLGKMGGNMALRLVRGSADGSVPGGHSVVGYATQPNRDVEGVAGVTVAASVGELVDRLAPPRVAWVMVPAGAATEGVIADLASRLRPGDVVIDGGNSNYKDSVRRGEALAPAGIGFLDVGTSGGIWGRQEGYCLMIGGAPEHVERCRPLFDTLAPPGGWAHVGPVGAGHFTKVVHNGIEYGLMEAYAEGFEILYKSPFGVDLQRVAAVWNRGSVVRSWLLELAEELFKTEQRELRGIQPYVEDSGEGRWTVHAAMELDAPVPVLAAALFARFESRDPVKFSSRFVAGLRNQFGGHAVKRDAPALPPPTGT